MALPRSILVTMVMFLCGAGLAQAQRAFHWRGDGVTGNGTFSNPSHWSEETGKVGPPNADDFALFDSPGVYTVQMDGQETKWTEMGGAFVTHSMASTPPA